MPSFRPIFVVAGNTLREAVRQRLVVILFTMTLFMVGGVRVVGAFNLGGSQLKFVMDFGFGVIEFFGAALAVVGTSQLFFSEIEQRTIFALFAKPISHEVYLIGKFVGMLGLITFFWAVMMVTLAGVLWMMAHAVAQESAALSGMDFSAFFGSAVGQLMRMVVLLALTLLVASFSKTQLFTSAVGFALWAMCHLQSIAQNAVDRSTAGPGRWAAKALALGVPDFQLFDFTGAIVSVGEFHWAVVGRLVIFTVTYTAAITCLAAFGFRRREF